MNWSHALSGFLAAGSLASAPAHLRAQNGMVVGTVVARRTTAPVSEATVRVEGVGTVTRTDSRGAFRVAVPNGDVRLQITRIGYAPVLMRARGGDPTITITLDERVVDLDAVVVTGQAGATELRALGNAVGRIDVSDIVSKAPPPKLQDMLSANVPGIRIMPGSGEVGVGGTTRVRGAGSLSLSNEPLIYVDGVRVDNSNTANGAGYGRGLGYLVGKKVGFQWDVPSRINDLDPEQIETVEVIKGPAASALYGTEAANGVIQILTKRGRAGHPVWAAHGSVGANWLPDQEHSYPSTWFVNDSARLQEFNLLAYDRKLGYPAAFRTGHVSATGLSLGGGSEAMRFFVSGDFGHDDGIVRSNWQNKFNGRGNLSYATERLQVDVNYGAVRSRTRTSSGAWPYTAYIISSCTSYNPCDTLPETRPSNPAHAHGWAFGTTPTAFDSTQSFDNIDRTIGGVKVAHAITPWLKQRLQLGADISTNGSDNMIPRGTLGFFYPDGYRAISTLQTAYYTMEYGAAATWGLGRGIESQLSAATQYYQKTHQYVSAIGRKFSLPGSSDLSGALLRESSEDYLANKTLGIYIQEQLAWRNRFFITAAVRGDDNSAFGANYDFVTYPKLSATWVLSDEPNFASRLPFLETFKVRAAYGRAGQQPDAYAAVKQYQAAAGYTGQGGVTPLAIGNADLRPEVSSEVELGFDASAWHQRATLELTYYRKTTDDVILAAPLKPSSGFPGTKYVNGGQTRNSGFELAMSVTPVSRRGSELTLRGTVATNASSVNALLPGVSSIYVGEFVRQYNVVGYAPYSYFYKRVVDSNILTEPDTSKWRVNCEGGAEFSGGDGTSVPCAQANSLYQGRPTPSVSGSVSSELMLFGRVRLFALVDVVGGNSIVSGDVYWPLQIDKNTRQSAAAKFVMDAIRLNGSLTGTQALASVVDPRLAGIIRLTELGDAGASEAAGVMRNGFARLRTVSASYTLTENLARRLGAAGGSVTLSANNLSMLWRAQSHSFGWKYVDPEIGQNNGQNGLALYQQERWPQSTRASLAFRLTY